MKIYTFFTPSHRIFYENYFLKTLPKNFELRVFEEKDQTCKTGTFHSEGWADTTVKKIDIFIQACLENMNDYFFYCDVDVQFFDSNIKEILLQEIGSNDIACQDDISSFNSGVFICKATHKTLDMFRYMKQHFNLSDQPTFNRFLPSCKHKKLSRKFYTTGFSVGLWKNQKFNLPKNIVMHHANWVVGIEEKIKVLNLVREKYYDGSV